MNNKDTEKTIGLLKRISLVSAIFAVLLCVLIIVNFVQTNRIDPLNTTALNALTERLKSNPADEKLRDEIRELDLLARKAFFTNQWQVRAGGYMLLISVLVMFICLKSIEAMQTQLPAMPTSDKSDFWNNEKLKSKWVTYTGIGVVAMSFLLAFLTHQQLGKNLSTASTEKIATKDSVQNSAIPNKQSDEKQVATNQPTKDSTSNNKKVVAREFPTQEEIKNNFPSFRGPNGIGLSNHKNIPVNWDGKSGKNIKWKFEIPLAGNNSPIIWNDRVFISGAKDQKKQIYCIDINSGKLLWTCDIASDNSGQAPQVSAETGQAAPTLTTDGIRVYGIFSTGDLIAVDWDGKKVWSKNLGLPQNHYGHSSSLIMFNNLVIVQFDQRSGAFVAAFDGKSGKEIWKTPRPDVKISWSSPILIHSKSGAEVVLGSEPFVISYNAANGKELWRMDCLSGEVGPSLAYSNGLVFSVNEYAKLAAIEIGASPKIKWEDTEFLSDVPSPVANDEYLFLSTSYGTVVCFDAKTGTKFWTKELGNNVYASPMIVEGKVYLLDKKGVMHILKIDKTYTVVGTPQIGESAVSTPAFADGKIILRGEKNLFCVGK